MTIKITSANWNTALYYSDNLIAFISLGAGPAMADSSNIEIQYHVTLSNKDYEDLYQSTHHDLDSAVDTLNQKYGDWNVKNLEKAESEDSNDSGCSTCAAH
jgi:hypothetical protein